MFESCRPRQPVNRTLILAWQSIGVTTCVGFIIGFPHDTPETVRHDIEIVKRELPADLVEFFVLTPVPGKWIFVSASWQILLDKTNKTTDLGRD